MIKKETFFVKLNMEENGTLNYIESCEIREFEKMKFSSFDEFFDFIAGNGKKTRNANIYVHCRKADHRKQKTMSLHN